MTTRSSPFGGDAFTTADARRVGLSLGAVRGPMFARPFHGVAQWAAGGPASTDDIWRLCRTYAPRMKPGQFFSHVTALGLWGAPLPNRLARELHVSAFMPAAPPRTTGVQGHKLRPRDDARVVLEGLTVARAAVAWAQAADALGEDAAVAAGDFLIARRRPLATLEELRHELCLTQQQRRLPWVDELRDGAESPKETALRLVIVRAGLPEPELNVNLLTASGDFIARLDGAYRRWRVAVEFDGRQHADDVAQFRKDADRWDKIRDEGWFLVRILQHHLANGGAVAVEKVRRALWDRGWRPNSA